MRAIKDLLASLLTSGKYQTFKEEANVDAMLRLLVLNTTYTLVSVLVIGIGIKDIQNDNITMGLVQLILGVMIFAGLSLLRTPLPFIIGGLIVTTIFGCFCVISLFTKYDLRGLNALWIYSFPLMSIYTLGLRAGLIPAIFLFIITAFGTFADGFTRFNYNTTEAMLICGVYLLILVLTAAYDYVRSIKDRWLEKQDHYLQMVFDNSPDIIMLFDKDVQLIYCAKVLLEIAEIKSFAEIHKTNYEELMSRFMSIELLTELIAIFRTSSEEMKPIIFERTMDFSKKRQLAGWRPRHYEIHFTPMYDNNDVFQGAFILFHDVTEIMLAKERMEQASRAKSSFLSNMSHEIRTPLNAIIGMTTIARNSDDSNRKDYCLDKIKSASGHLLGIINDILDMSKIEENKFELSLTEFDFDIMVQRVVSIFEFRLNEKKQSLTIEKDPSIPKRIISDEQRLAQVITNLLSNAIKFTPDKGAISLSMRRLEETEAGFCNLEISVSDTGIGIPEEQQGKLFHSFVQVDSSIARKFGGTGLGLAISKKIVELMSGAIRVESEENKGATFIFTMRAGIPDVTDEKAGFPEEAVYEEVNYHGKRILLAEDIEINREIVITILEPLGLEIIEAEDGKKAYDLFCENPDKFDLIFMDIHMPGINGYDSAQLIRAFDHPKSKTIPRVAMTANVFKEDIEHCLAAGMNSHIGKPLDFEAVMMTLKRYLAG
jgi:signal transduction histidine kinase/CheY-like chemotaxis protein